MSYAASVDAPFSCDSPPPSPDDDEALGSPDTSCYRALRCAEILDNVLEEFNPWDLNDNRRFFLDVALVCKAFLDPAMAVLWRELPNLSPLYKVLIPDDVLKTLTVNSRWDIRPGGAPVSSVAPSQCVAIALKRIVSNLTYK